MDKGGAISESDYDSGRTLSDKILEKMHLSYKEMFGEALRRRFHDDDDSSRMNPGPQKPRTRSTKTICVPLLNVEKVGDEPESDSYKANVRAVTNVVAHVLKQSKLIDVEVVTIVCSSTGWARAMDHAMIHQEVRLYRRADVVDVPGRRGIWATKGSVRPGQDTSGASGSADKAAEENGIPPDWDDDSQNDEEVKKEDQIVDPQVQRNGKPPPSKWNLQDIRNLLRYLICEGTSAANAWASVTTRAGIPPILLCSSQTETPEVYVMRLLESEGEMPIKTKQRILTGKSSAASSPAATEDEVERRWVERNLEPPRSMPSCEGFCPFNWQFELYNNAAAQLEDKGWKGGAVRDPSWRPGASYRSMKYFEISIKRAEELEASRPRKYLVIGDLHALELAYEGLKRQVEKHMTSLCLPSLGHGLVIKCQRHCIALQ